MQVQDIDDPPPFEITDERSITMACPPSPIIQPDQPRHTTCRLGSSSGHPKQCISAHRKNEMLRGPVPRSATKDKSNLVHNPFTPLSPPLEALGECWIKLMTDLPRF